MAELEIEIDPDFLTLAMTHRSFAYENGGLPTNERLEFLGDAVLGVVVTEHLYVEHPDLSEGQLAKLRAAVVNARALAGVARDLHLGSLIRLGRGEINSGGADKSSILADTTEALIGAIFLVHGHPGAGRLVHHLFDPLMVAASQLGAGLDWKTSVQEMVSSQGLGIPTYEVSESGPDHAKEFQAWLVVDGEAFGPGSGRNKKQAEQEAAAAAFRVMDERVAAAVADALPDETTREGDVAVDDDPAPTVPSAPTGNAPGAPTTSS